jgi:hypothetical protein
MDPHRDEVERLRVSPGVWEQGLTIALQGTRLTASFAPIWDSDAYQGPPVLLDDAGPSWGSRAT